MRGLYDKFSRHPDTKVLAVLVQKYWRTSTKVQILTAAALQTALVHEFEGRYTQAMAIYNQLLSGGEEMLTEEGFGELEADLWEDGLEECLKRAHRWS